MTIKHRGREIVTQTVTPIDVSMIVQNSLRETAMIDWADDRIIQEIRACMHEQNATEETIERVSTAVIERIDAYLNKRVQQIEAQLVDRYRDRLETLESLVLPPVVPPLPEVGWGRVMAFMASDLAIETADAYLGVPLTEDVRRGMRCVRPRMHRIAAYDAHTASPAEREQYAIDLENRDHYAESVRYFLSELATIVTEAEGSVD